ncbi:PhzF family phenazine biosynthesis protein [Pseudoxanthomonas koreensis]|uniref:PhzF family phenazine biosynthesis protein n=1 Tax=Pseudoxanthomonas koreensis TaxID=266061 RepID=UPI0013909425|nr:PhzF family phenazine biosynthesis protein [Pseudoxanthomonas koreensis]KAF1690523.1 phenazine biosynthesis protein PhzF family [Pseudoxanthomonas koreensis]
MASRPFVQVDVFADRPGAGNPLAVLPDATGLDEAAMQAIARWTRLPETTFVFPPTRPGASYAIRMFSPKQEVPFAGHPSVGTAHVVLEAGLAEARDGLLLQEGIAGVLPLRVDADDGVRRIAIRTPRARLLETADARGARMAEALDWLPTGELPPALMDGGRRWWVAEARDEASLRNARPDWEAIAGLARATATMGVLAFARCDGSDYQVAARAFVGGPAVFEDAASGAANATLAAWLSLRDALPGHDGRYRVSQGREVGYDARLDMHVDAEGEVWSGGQVVSVVRGTIDWR